MNTMVNVERYHDEYTMVCSIHRGFHTNSMVLSKTFPCSSCYSPLYSWYLSVYCTHPGVLHRHYTFCFHFLVCENELEELLTVYTKTNKSAALFLGTRSESEPESCKGSRREQVSDRWFLGDVEYQEPVVPKSETWRDILKQSSEDQGSLLLSDQYNRSLAATSVNTSHYATFANVNPYASQNQ